VACLLISWPRVVNSSTFSVMIPALERVYDEVGAMMAFTSPHTTQFNAIVER
jgi:hypothetical protein